MDKRKNRKRKRKSSRGIGNSHSEFIISVPTDAAPASLLQTGVGVDSVIQPYLSEEVTDHTSNKRKRTKKRRKQEKVKTDPILKPPADSALDSLHKNPSDQDLAFPFPANNDDHCETPLEAYQDILPFLHAVSHSLKKDASQTVIYDPYYCSGSVIHHLASCGYTSVWNKKQDCYSVWESSQSYPRYDMLVTNPPYSADHIQRLISHLTSQSSLHESRAWFLLLPTWVHKKDYYLDALSKNSIQPFYLVPKRRYVYKPPAGFREKRSSDVHKKNSPFVSMWYVFGGSYQKTEKLIQVFSTSQVSKTCELARTKNALRDLRRKK